MSEPVSKSYSPREVESRIYRKWLDARCFSPTPDERPPERRFVMVIPPPNVTGALHLGHALNNTLQDILVRQKRMAGCNTLWLPGTDHAGIATQATVEKDIQKNEKKTRHDLGRDELVRRIWEWKEKFGNRIVEQLRLMGCSCDWDRTRFTLDDTCARAVRETFFKLFRDGLIYRGKRLVNWDTQLQTAVADDEVYHETVKGHLWHIRYPLKEPAVVSGETGDIRVTHLIVATTRPETMLGDTAVAVHPEDPRYAPLIGRTVILPLMDREIPIIGDGLLVKREFGTGCVKVTPAHDPNDYACAQRHNLSMINLMTPDGRVNENGGPYAGQKFEDARKKVVADLEAEGLLEKTEDYETEIGHSDRSKVPIQPYLSDQWFVRMGDLPPEQAAKIPGLHGAKGLADLALRAVEDGRVRFYPERYAKTYLDWLGEKRDWCISRQLWWGHRIPVWTREMKLSDLLHPQDADVECLFEITAHDSIVSVHEIGSPRRWHDIERDAPNATGWEELLQVLQAGDCDVRVSICPKPYVPWTPLEREEFAETLTRMKIPTLDKEGNVITTSYTADDIEDDPPNLRDRVERYAEDAGFVQDPDVLDTWFSSALWPHSTLGWPGLNPVAQAYSDAARAEARGSLSSARGASSDLEYYYPTSTLSTAREIITLWVARMVMTGLYNVGKVPFRDVVIHAVIQDGQGRKMSKTLGNGVDPQDIIDAYGADALRYTLAELATETQDIRIPVKPLKLPDGRQVNTSERFEKGRNFCNKLWQVATGYVMSNLDGYAPRPLARDGLALEDRWILSRLSAATRDVNAALAGYHFADYAQALYGFLWNDYCDWYVEMTKPRLREGGASRAAAQQVLVHCLDQVLRLLHPAAPFVTEAIWELLEKAAPKRGLSRLIEPEPLLTLAAWPEADASLSDTTVEADVEILKTIIRSIRDIRTRVNALRSGQPALRTLPRAVVRGNPRCCELLKTHATFVKLLAAVDAVESGESVAKPAGCMTSVHEAAQVFVPVGDLVDLAAERTRLEAELANKQDAYQREAERLANPTFVERATGDVVERTRARAAELQQQANLLREYLADLG